MTPDLTPRIPPSQAPGFLDKNKESLNPDLRRLLLSSQLPLVALLVDPLDDDDGATTARGGKKKRVTVMGQFKRELGELMHVLQSSGTHFIRCIKPSPKQEPGHWDAPMVLSQLRCSGLMAAVQLMAMGYPCRATYTELFDIFSSMPGLDRLASLGPKNFCTALLMAVEVPRAQMFHGVQRVFLKAGQIGFLERLRSQGATIDQDIIEKVMRFMIERPLAPRLRRRHLRAAHPEDSARDRAPPPVAARRAHPSGDRTEVGGDGGARPSVHARAKMQTAARGRAAREAYKVARAAIVVLQRHGRGRPPARRVWTHEGGGAAPRADRAREEDAQLVQVVRRAPSIRAPPPPPSRRAPAASPARRRAARARGEGGDGGGGVRAARRREGRAVVAARTRGGAGASAQRGKVGRDGLAVARGAARAVQRAGRQTLWVVARHRGAAEVQRLTLAVLERKWLGLRRRAARARSTSAGLLANATPAGASAIVGLCVGGRPARRPSLAAHAGRGAAALSEGGTHADAPPPPPPATGLAGDRSPTRARSTSC